MTEHDAPVDGPRNDRETRYNEFVGLLARHDQSIRRFVRSLLPSRDGVDDVMQETALECWRKFDTFQPDNPQDAPGEFIRWACVIARYKALSWQRDRQRDRLVFREGIVERLADAAIDHVRRREQQRRAIENCLDALPGDDRRLVLSVHVPGQSVARFAAETGQQARRQYSRVNVLRKRLLECVEKRLAGEGAHG